jgi:hypothetical protein
MGRSAARQKPGGIHLRGRFGGRLNLQFRRVTHGYIRQKKTVLLFHMENIMLLARDGEHGTMTAYHPQGNEMVESDHRQLKGSGGLRTVASTFCPARPLGSAERGFGGLLCRNGCWGPSLSS